METESTTISLAKLVRDRLRTFGNKGETYDTILNRIMDDSVTVNTPPYGGEYYTEDETADLVHDLESFREYVYGEDGVVVDGMMYKKSEVERFRNR